MRKNVTGKKVKSSNQNLMNDMTRLITYIFFALFTYFISGCAVGPNFQKPVVESPKEFRFDSSGVDSVATLEWWELFNDTVLDTLIREALRQNYDVRIAAARIEEARAAWRYNRADNYPWIGYEGNIQGNTLNPVLASGSTDIKSTYYAAPVLSWEIDIWGKYRRATESARAEMLATEYAHRGIMISLISDVTALYFQLLDYDNRLEISKSTLVTRQEYLNIMQERYNKGIIAEIELNQAQIQEAIAASAVPVYTRLVAETENVLSILLGRNPGPILRGMPLEEQVIPPDIPPGLPSDLLLRRPDILQAEQMVASQNAMIGVAQAMRFPTFSLTGLFGVASPELTTAAISAAWSVSGSILGPIFNFGKNKRRVEIERKRTEQAYYMYDQAALQSFRETEDALIGITTLKDQLIAVERQRDAAENAYMLSRARYDEGITSYLEVLDSQKKKKLQQSRPLRKERNRTVGL
ncbi:MAG: efflux transporter outer membrane subunit [Bacteroidales bacterium]|nr:efflux transporter outer membrane subunit [Bacteroidales bacterium]